MKGVMGSRHGVAAGMLALAVALLAGCFLLVSPAFAQVEEAESAEEAVSSTSTSGSMGFTLGDDYVWAGDALSLVNTSVDNDVLAAGNSLSVKDCAVLGSIRIAGNNILVDNCDVSHSITLAGNKVSVEQGSAQAVAIAGRVASFTGETGDLFITANDAVINGTVHGDATIAANNVTLGPDAVVEGTLHVESDKEPMIDSAAVIGEMRLDTSDDDDNAVLSVGGTPLIGGIAGLDIAGMIGKLIRGILVFMAIALLCEWLGRKQVANALEMACTHTGAFVGTGLIATLAAPFALIILCITVIGLPVAGAVACAMVAMALVGGGFLCASLAPVVFKNMGPWKRVILLSLIVGACSALPIVGALISFAGFVYLLAYVLQSIYRHAKTPVAAQPVQA